jgi:hypothetical protein
VRQLTYASFPYFMSRLVDPAGRPLEVAPHHELWARHLSTEHRVVLLAPRSHGKTWLVLSFILWLLWRHGRSPVTGERLPGPAGTYTVALLSATRPQAGVHMATFKDLLTANAELFGGVPAPGEPGTSWSATRVRLASGAELITRAFRTSTRGMHPDMLVCDDILSDANSGSQHQRDLTWEHFVGTLLPMHATRVVVIGTAFHRDDLLHRLAPGGRGAAHGFAWHRYMALDEAAGTTLWHRHPFEELARIQIADRLAFSREYQNDPRDDASSMFPRELTEHALAAGADLTFVPRYRNPPGGVVVLGLDPAVAEGATADYTVAVVAAVDPATMRRRVLTIRRHRGLALDAQVALVRELCSSYDVTLGIVEDNGFQAWLLQALRRHPETAHRVFGHTTGMERSSLAEGIPSLKLALQADLWVVPCGDAESAALALEWQEELAGFGWRDGRLASAGAHDDLVLATWLLERGVRFATDLLAGAPREEVITGEDLGIELYHIGPELDAADERWAHADPDEVRYRRWLADG